jgi:hypothetical protein
MQSFPEALYKSTDNISLGWNPEPGNVSAYNLYVGYVPAAGSLTRLDSSIGSRPSTLPGNYGKVVIDVSLSDVSAALGSPLTGSFSNSLLYFALTTINSVGTESNISNSVVSEIPPVGVLARVQREDPTSNRHVWGFSDELQKWSKAAASGRGALITDPSDYYKANITTEYTWDGTNLASTRSYLSDLTASGSPAKLTTYEYTGSQLDKVIIIDSTVS